MQQPGSPSYGGGGPFNGGYQVPYNPYMAQQNGAPRQQQQPPSGYPQQGQMPQMSQMPPSGSPFQTSPAPNAGGSASPPTEQQSYIENILRLNKGKLASVFMTFEGAKENNTKLFKGIIEAAGRDHLILSDPQTGMRYLLPLIYLDYVSFDEEIEYAPEFGGLPR
ncbi:spore coat protein GerQ [Pradoshia sp.]|uniref:spore coat protein GerQ n=1 Tax=Pradoshia sp. TaxID=2651281 RepID=UPI003F0A5162